jgi:hypothetical protein
MHNCVYDSIECKNQPSKLSREHSEWSVEKNCRLTLGLQQATQRKYGTQQGERCIPEYWHLCLYQCRIMESLDICDADN